MDNIKAPDVLLSMHNDTSPAHVAPTSNENNVSGVKFDDVSDLALLEIIFDSVVDFNNRIGITNCASVVGDNVGNSVGANSYSADFQELVGGFFRCDTVDGETTLDIVEESEVLARFFDRDDIHEAGGVGSVCADFAVDFDYALLDNGGDLPSSQSILQPVAKENCERKRLSKLVRSWRGARCVCPAQFIQHP